MTGDKTPNIDGARKAAAMMLRIGLDAGIFTPAKGRLLARETMLRDAELAAFDAEPAINVAERAIAGDRDARLVVHTAIAAFVRMEESIPPALRPYLLRLLDVGEVGPIRRGVNPHNDFAQIEWLIVTIRAVAEYGVEPTRSSATADKGQRESACSIIREELNQMGRHVEESALNKIWSKRHSSD